MTTTAALQQLDTFIGTLDEEGVYAIARLRLGSNLGGDSVIPLSFPAEIASEAFAIIFREAGTKGRATQLLPQHDALRTAWAQAVREAVFACSTGQTPGWREAALMPFVIAGFRPTKAAGE